MGPEQLRHCVIFGIITAPIGNRRRNVVAGGPGEPDAEPVGRFFGGADPARIPAEAAQDAVGNALCVQHCRVAQDIVGDLVAKNHRQLVVALEKCEQSGGHDRIAIMGERVDLA